VIAGFADGYTGTNFLDDACSLVTKCHRHITRQFTCNHVIVGVADAGGGYFYLYFVLLWWIKLDLFDADRFAWCV